MQRKKLRVRPYRIAAAILGVIALVMLSRFPAKAVSLERQSDYLNSLASVYHAAQSKNNQLRNALSEVNTADYVERIARREYGYSWYGETVYVVGNPDELQSEAEFEVYGQD